MKQRALMVTLALVAAGTYDMVAAENVDFASQVQPLFVKHCTKCHGTDKASGKLRLHSADAIQAGIDGDEGLLVAGKFEESELYRRLVLPQDDRKRMPKSADPLPAEDIALIRLWITQGGKFTTDAADQQQETSAAEKELPLPDVASAAPHAIQGLTAAGAQVLPLFAESPLLQVSFAHRSEPAGDADLALLTEVAEQVVALNLAGAQISDAGCAVLAELSNLRQLHLERSSITDADLSHLDSLSALHYLNLYGTAVTDNGLQHLHKLPRLRKLYLWQAPISYEAAMTLEAKIPGLVVNLGYDHPAIVRQRLTKQIAEVTEQVAAVTTDEEQAKKKLDEARQRKTTLESRLAELQKSLQELNGDAEMNENEDASSEESAG